MNCKLRILHFLDYPMLRIVGREFRVANLGNDHGFISKEDISIGMRPFGEVQSKAMRAYAQSVQYHTMIEVCNF